MNEKNCSKNQRKIQLNLEKKKLKISIKVLKVKQKVRESICIRILDDSIFAKIQPLNKYSKGVKRKCGYQRTDCIFKVELLESKNYRKLRNRMG